MSQFYGRSLDEWINIIHKSISIKYDTPMKHLRVSGYGHSMYACILGGLLSSITTTDIMTHLRGRLPMDGFVDTAHIAWIGNFLEWKNYKREKLHVDIAQGNEKATTYTSCLNAVDRDMYLDMINALFDALSSSALEAGIQLLSIQS